MCLSSLKSYDHEDSVALILLGEAYLQQNECVGRGGDQ